MASNPIANEVIFPNQNLTNLAFPVHIPISMLIFWAQNTIAHQALLKIF